MEHLFSEGKGQITRSFAFLASLQFFYHRKSRSTLALYHQGVLCIWKKHDSPRVAWLTCCLRSQFETNRQKTHLILSTFVQNQIQSFSSDQKLVSTIQSPSNFLEWAMLKHCMAWWRPWVHPLHQNDKCPTTFASKMMFQLMGDLNFEQFYIYRQKNEKRRNRSGNRFLFRTSFRVLASSVMLSRDIYQNGWWRSQM